MRRHLRPFNWEAAGVPGGPHGPQLETLGGSGAPACDGQSTAHPRHTVVPLRAVRGAWRQLTGGEARPRHRQLHTSGPRTGLGSQPRKAGQRWDAGPPGFARRLCSLVPGAGLLPMIGRNRGQPRPGDRGQARGRRDRIPPGPPGHRGPSRSGIRCAHPGARAARPGPLPASRRPPAVRALHPSRAPRTRQPQLA